MVQRAREKLYGNTPIEMPAFSKKPYSKATGDWVKSMFDAAIAESAKGSPTGRRASAPEVQRLSSSGRQSGKSELFRATYGGYPQTMGRRIASGDADTQRKSLLEADLSWVEARILGNMMWHWRDVSGGVIRSRQQEEVDQEGAGAVFSEAERLDGRWDD
jgi:hypothetical protein